MERARNRRRAEREREREPERREKEKEERRDWERKELPAVNDLFSLSLSLSLIINGFVYDQTVCLLTL